VLVVIAVILDPAPLHFFQLLDRLEVDPFSSTITPLLSLMAITLPPSWWTFSTV